MAVALRVMPQATSTEGRLTRRGAPASFRASCRSRSGSSRQGKKKTPFYRIVAADKRRARDSRFIELLGTYHPITKVLKLDREKYGKWLKVGAKPSGTLAAIRPPDRPRCCRGGDDEVVTMAPGDDSDDDDDAPPARAGPSPRATSTSPS